MAVLGKNRLAMPRDEFEAWASQRKPETRKRYLREYNAYHRQKPSQKVPKGKKSVKGKLAKPKKAGYHRQGPGVGPIIKEGEGNRYAIVVKAEYKRKNKMEERYYSILKGNTNLSDDDLAEVIDQLRIDYHVGGSRVRLVPVQTVDRFLGTRVIH